MTSYATLYKRCLAKIEDPVLAMMSDEDLKDILHGYLVSAIAKHRTCEHDLSDRDDELMQFNSDLSDIELEIVAILMAREWVSQQLLSVTNTLQVFSGKETKLGRMSTVRCIWKHCSVFLRICWEALRAMTLKRKDEICLYGIA